VSHPFAYHACALALFLSASIPRTLGAQSDSVTLQALLAEAERASPRLVAATEAVRAATARIPTSTRPPDPQVQLGWMNYGLPDGRPMTPLSMRQLQVMQMVPVAGRLRASRAVAHSAANESRSLSAAARAQVRRETAAMFFELHRVDRALALARETQQIVADLAQTSAAMYRAGEGQQADVIRAEVEVARMAAEVDRMTAMRTATAARLVAMLARVPGTTIGPTEAMPLPTSLPPLDSLLALALRRRPELGAADASVAGAVAAERLAHSELWPDLTVGVQVADGRDLAGMRETMGSLMVGASVPIFARRRQLAMREEADAMRAMAEADRAMIAAETGGDVGMAHAELTRTRQLRAIYTGRVLPSARAALQSALSAYRGGTVPFMAVLDAQMALNRYSEELLLLEAEEGEAWAALESFTGANFLTPGVATPGARND
jgi:cobalt-zinc-cadmium efflux system outer membrane protein